LFHSGFALTRRPRGRGATPLYCSDNCNHFFFIFCLKDDNCHHLKYLLDNSLDTKLQEILEKSVKFTRLKEARLPKKGSIIVTSAKSLFPNPQLDRQWLRSPKLNTQLDPTGGYGAQNFTKFLSSFLGLTKFRTISGSETGPHKERRLKWGESPLVSHFTDFSTVFVIHNCDAP
jgi:hypothetical protein